MPTSLGALTPVNSAVCPVPLCGRPATPRVASSGTSVACRLERVRFRSEGSSPSKSERIAILRAEDLVEGWGISADITGAGWQTLGYPDMPIIEPAEAGQCLARLSAQHDFVLFEYWKPDHAGHARNMNEAIDVLQRFDAMLIGILESLDSSDTLLLITSDHGNVEDLSSKSHTRNPVPAILYGHRHDEIAHRLSSASRRSANIAHVTPTLMEALAAEEQPARLGTE